MKKILFLSVLFCLIFASKSFALQIQNVYSVECSTITPTTTPNIDSASVRVKQIVVSNGATVQRVTIYKNAKTGLTPAIVAKFDVPASTNFYFPSTVLNDETNFDVPYFSVISSTSTNPANVTVIYKS